MDTRHNAVQTRLKCSTYKETKLYGYGPYTIPKAYGKKAHIQVHIGNVYGTHSTSKQTTYWQRIPGIFPKILYKYFSKNTLQVQLYPGRCLPPVSCAIVQIALTIQNCMHTGMRTVYRIGNPGARVYPVQFVLVGTIVSGTRLSGSPRSSSNRQSELLPKSSQPQFSLLHSLP